MSKFIRIENPTKGGGYREQGMVKNQLEILKEGKASLCTHKYSLHFALFEECTRTT